MRKPGPPAGVMRASAARTCSGVGAVTGASSSTWRVIAGFLLAMGTLSGKVGSTQLPPWLRATAGSLLHISRAGDHVLDPCTAIGVAVVPPPKCAGTARGREQPPRWPPAPAGRRYSSRPVPLPCPAQE